MSAPQHEVSLDWKMKKKQKKKFLGVHGSSILTLNFGRHRDMRNFTSVAK